MTGSVSDEERLAVARKTHGSGISVEQLGCLDTLPLLDAIVLAERRIKELAEDLDAQREAARQLGKQLTHEREGFAKERRDLVTLLGEDL